MQLWIIFLLVSLFPSGVCAENTPPELILAKVYKGNVDLSQYWVSEKLDGVRAYWDGKKLVSRQGNIFPAPDWFIKNFPDYALDGELWLERGKFQQLLSIVSKSKAIDKEWQQIRYFVFDIPNLKKPFTQRLTELEQLVGYTKSQYLQVVKQYQLTDHSELMQRLEHIVEQGGEGLMLHRGDALNRKGRSNDLLKVKPYFDAEAIVIGHTEGKGKFSGMLGALVVKTGDGKKFRIGSGFSNQQRRSPSAIGTIITYKYHGKTNRGIPRFASFLRERKGYSWESKH